MIVLTNEIIGLYSHLESFDEKMEISPKYNSIDGHEKTFEFDHVCLLPQKQIPLHSQDTWELSCVMTGAGMRQLEDVSEAFDRGDVVLVPPGMRHCWYFNEADVDPQGNIENVSVFFDPSLLKRIADTFPEMIDVVNHLSGLKEALIFTGETRRRIYSALVGMIDESRHKRIISFMKILVLIAENEDSSRKVLRKPYETREALRMSQIHSYVSCNYSRQISLDEIARHVGMNRTSFCTFFKKNAGMTFVQYLNEKRLEISCDRLAVSDKNVNEICASVGIPDTAYFCRIFKKKYNMTPSQWRNQ